MTDRKKGTGSKRLTFTPGSFLWFDRPGSGLVQVWFNTRRQLEIFRFRIGRRSIALTVDRIEIVFDAPLDITQDGVKIDILSPEDVSHPCDQLHILNLDDMRLLGLLATTMQAQFKGQIIHPPIS